MKKLSAALLLFFGLASAALAQTQPTPAITGNTGAYNSTPPSCTAGRWCALQTDVNGNLKISSGTSGYPTGATPVASSSNGANTTVTTGLGGVAGKTTYITGFEITGSGATAGSVIYATVTGTIAGVGNLVYAIAVPTGVTAGITPLVVEFPLPIPASAQNTGIFVSVPAFGAGNTNVAVSVHGFQQ